jgi:hypothetical protein
MELYVTYTIAVCTVKNSGRRTEELSETCRVSFQNKFEKLVHLVGFITRNITEALKTITCYNFKCKHNVKVRLTYSTY